MSDKKGWGVDCCRLVYRTRRAGMRQSTTDFGDVPDQPPPPRLKTTRLLRRRSRFFRQSPPPPTGGQVDFAAVFEAAGVDQEEQQRVARTTDLLRSLPAGTDAAVKKQIVEASLKAFGVPIEKIIEATVEEIQALDGYIRNGAADNEKLIQESDARIKQYEQEIQNIRSCDAAECRRAADV